MHSGPTVLDHSALSDCHFNKNEIHKGDLLKSRTVCNMKYVLVYITACNVVGLEDDVKVPAKNLALATLADKKGNFKEAWKGLPSHNLCNPGKRSSNLGKRGTPHVYPIRPKVEE